MSDGLRGEPVWHKGLLCEGGACVEVSAVGDAVMVRSTANPGGAPVTLSRDEWHNFLAEVKAGAFDRV